MAAGSLGVAVDSSSLKDAIQTEVLDPSFTDTAGDEELITSLVHRDPDFLGLSLYLWNSERSLYIAGELKKKNPRTKIILGGPEVSPDNLSLLVDATFDYALVGESEHVFPALLESIVKREDLSRFPNLLFKDDKGFHVSESLDADFPLSQFPNPYLSGKIPVDSNRSTYIETVRGCKSQCTYCFYPKSSNVLRSIDIDETRKLIKGLKERGARELVFLDPTFNHRPQFEAFLDSIIEVNSDLQMKMFAEMRPEGLNLEIIKKLKKANFYKIEIGLQSINPETLKRVKRFGNPERVLGVAKMMKEVGIEPLLDLIIGLPGDTKEDVLRGIDTFKNWGLEEYVQAFLLSVLPGTEMRRNAELEGLDFLLTPPYRVIGTKTFTGDELIETFLLSEEMLGRRLDEYPRPFLCNDIGEGDSFLIDLDFQGNYIHSEGKNGRRHSSIIFRGTNLFEKINQILDVLQKRILRDPYCTLDIVLNPKNSFPFNLLDSIQKFIRESVQSYQSRVLSHRGENFQRRLVVLLDSLEQFPSSWTHFLSNQVPVFVDIFPDEAIKKIKQLGRKIPGMRIICDTIEEIEWKKLQKGDPELIIFASRDLERRWCHEVLGYGE